MYVAFQTNIFSAKEVLAKIEFLALLKSYKLLLFFFILFPLDYNSMLIH